MRPHPALPQRGRETDGHGSPPEGGRVLMVSQHPFPSHATQPPFWGHPTMCRNLDGLLAHGVQVDLVCTTPRLCVGRRLPGWPGLRIYGFPMWQRRSPAIWYPLQYLAFFAWALFVVSGLALRRRYDVVQVDNIPDLLVFSTLVPRLRRMPIVFFMYELMPEMTATRLSLGASDRAHQPAWAAEACQLFRRIRSSVGGGQGDPPVDARAGAAPSGRLRPPDAAQQGLRVRLHGHPLRLLAAARDRGASSRRRGGVLRTRGRRQPGQSDPSTAARSARGPAAGGASQARDGGAVLGPRQSPLPQSPRCGRRRRRSARAGVLDDSRLCR